MNVFAVGRAGPEEVVETEINEKLADEKFVESLNVGGLRRRGCGVQNEREGNRFFRSSN